MMVFFFIICMVGNMQLVIGSMDGESIIIERDIKEEGEKRVSFCYNPISHEYIFNMGLDNIFAKKVEPKVKQQGYVSVQYAIQNCPRMLSLHRIEGQLPLLYAFNRRDQALTRIIAQTERYFFIEGSQRRLDSVLNSAVKEQEYDMVKILLDYGASTSCRDGHDVLLQLVLNCVFAKKRRSGCFWRSNCIDSQREESALRIATLLIDRGASSQLAVSAVEQSKCLGVGCSYIVKELKNKPSAPFPE